MPKTKTATKKAASANGDARSNGDVKNTASALQTSSAADSNAKQAATPAARSTEIRTASVSEEQIRRRAYELYTQRGGTHGHHVDDWFRAEAELLGQTRRSA
jgi:hypothetical protein